MIFRSRVAFPIPTQPATGRDGSFLVHPQRRNRLNQTTDWRFTDFFDDSDGLLNNSLAWGSTLRHLYWKVFTSSRFQRHRFAIAIVTGHSFIFGSSNLEVENPVLAY